MKERKNKIRVKRNIILWIIADLFVLALVIYFMISYVNFFKISKEKNPLISGEKRNYSYNSGKVTVNDYKIYKIIKYEMPDKKVTYSMKLWFMKDVR